MASSPKRKQPRAAEPERAGSRGAVTGHRTGLPAPPITIRNRTSDAQGPPDPRPHPPCACAKGAFHSRGQHPAGRTGRARRRPQAGRADRRSAGARGRSRRTPSRRPGGAPRKTYPVSRHGRYGHSRAQGRNRAAPRQAARRFSQNPRGQARGRLDGRTPSPQDRYPDGCGSSSSAAEGASAKRHGKSYLTRRRRGGEGGGGGSLTGGAIPSAYRWAWFRWITKNSRSDAQIPINTGVFRLGEPDAYPISYPIQQSTRADASERP